MRSGPSSTEIIEENLNVIKKCTPDTAKILEDKIRARFEDNEKPRYDGFFECMKSCTTYNEIIAMVKSEHGVDILIRAFESIIRYSKNRDQVFEQLRLLKEKLVTGSKEIRWDNGRLVDNRPQESQEKSFFGKAIDGISSFFSKTYAKIKAGKDSILFALEQGAIYGAIGGAISGGVLAGLSAIPTAGMSFFPALIVFTIVGFAAGGLIGAISAGSMAFINTCIADELPLTKEAVSPKIRLNLGCARATVSYPWFLESFFQESSTVIPTKKQIYIRQNTPLDGPLTSKLISVDDPRRNRIR